jgi:thiol:disulfide interchange protein DsbD
VLLLFAFGLAQGANAFSFRSESDFLPPNQVFKLKAWQVDGSQSSAAVTVAKGYYIYRKSLKLTDESGAPIDLTLPPGTEHHDEFFGDSEVYRNNALVLSVPASVHGAATLHWQGCADAGVCYPPQQIKVNLPVAGATGASGSGPGNGPGGRSRFSATAALPFTAALSSNVANAAPAIAEDQAAAQRLGSLSPALATLLFLGFGLLLAFTPCSLPMIPIISTLVVGSRARPRRALGLALAYVLAMAATYAVVGVVAGLAGANVQAALQSPWVLSAFAALFMLLAISLFGGFELQLPARLVNRLDAAGHRQMGGSLAGAGALGFLSALLVGPCMTAPLAGALLYIGQTGNAVMGGAALFALGIGMGLPLLLIAVFGARVLPRPGPWMERVRIAFGYVMAGMAVLMLSRFLPGTVSLLLWGALGLGVTVGLIGWTHALTLQKRAGWSVAFGAAFVGLWSVMMLTGAASGGDSPLRPLEHLALTQAGTSTTAPARVNYIPINNVQELDARLKQAEARGQWTLIDFYADWCVSCRVNERNVFGRPEVIQRLANLQVLRPDVTKFDADDQALLKRLQVLGPPTMILIAPDGKEARAQRMVGELSASDFLHVLSAAGVSG